MTNPQPPAAQADWAEELRKKSWGLFLDREDGSPPALTRVVNLEDAAAALREAVERGREQEREACAMLAQMRQKRHDTHCSSACKCADGNHVAAAIRQRGEKQ